MREIITEKKFRNRLIKNLEPLRGKVLSVVGRGRSGAVSAVYASHYLGIPFIPYSKNPYIPDKLMPLLIIDTAKFTGKSLRKMDRKMPKPHEIVYLWLEPPIVKFWYEVFK